MPISGTLKWATTVPTHRSYWWARSWISGTTRRPSRNSRRSDSLPLTTPRYIRVCVNYVHMYICNHVLLHGHNICTLYANDYFCTSTFRDYRCRRKLVQSSTLSAQHWHKRVSRPFSTRLSVLFYSLRKFRRRRRPVLCCKHILESSLTDLIFHREYCMR